MANPIIDDVYKEQFSKNKINSKKIIFFIFIFLFILIIVGVILLLFVNKKKQTVESNKAEFLSYLTKIESVSTFNIDKINDLISKCKSESSNIKSNILFTLENNSEEKEENEFEIHDMSLNIESLNDIKDNRQLIDTSINYKENDIFSFQILKTAESIGIKSDEIVNKYVGSSLTNLPKLINKILEMNNSDSEEFGTIEYNFTSDIDIDKLIEIKNDILNMDFNLSDNFWDKYIEIINANVEEAAFSKEEVTLKEKNLNVTKYNMTVSESKLKDIYKKLLETLKNDDELINKLLPILEKFDIEKADLENFISEGINQIDSIKTDDNKIYTLSLCVNNDRIERIILKIADEVSVDIDYGYDNSKKSINFTIVNEKANNGFAVNINETILDVSDKFEIVFSKIEDNKSTNEVTLSLNLVNNNSKYDLEAIVKYVDSSFTGEIDFSNTILFEDIEVPDLTDDICLFIDKLNDEQLTATITAVENQAVKVFDKKLSRFSFIDNSLESKFIEQPKIQDENNQELKEAAKQKIIKAVSDQMRKFKQEGKNYEFSNIRNLEIPDCEYSIIYNTDLAIITVDGFEFKLDSGFHLSE